MCGRFSVIEKAVSAFVNDKFEIEFKTIDNRDLRPTQTVARITKRGDGYQQQNANWGIKPKWSKKSIINAQAETAAVKNTFSKAMQ